MSKKPNKKPNQTIPVGELTKVEDGDTEVKVVVVSAKVDLVKTVTYTYVGSGDEPPKVIKFMDQITFVRGEPVEVEVCEKNKLLLRKIKGNKSFIEGELVSDTVSVGVTEENRTMLEKMAGRSLSAGENIEVDKQLYTADQKEANKAENQRKEDAEINKDELKQRAGYH